MARNPYKVPYCQAQFTPTYSVIQTLGFHHFTPVSDIWPNVYTKDVNTQPESIVYEVSPITDVADVICQNSLDQLGLKGAPSLLLEKNTGTVILYPEPVFRSTTLNAASIWPITGPSENPKDKLTWKGKGRELMDQQTLPIYWKPTDATENENAFVEFSFNMQSPHAGSKLLPEADNDVNPPNLIVKPGSNGGFLTGIGLTQERIVAGTDKMHYVQSAFNLAQGAGFFIAFKQFQPPLQYAKSGKEEVRIEWGRHFGFRFFKHKFEFSSNTAEDKYWEPVSGISSGNGFYLTDQPGVVFLLIQVIANSIVIQNAHQLLGDAKKDGAITSWRWKHPQANFEGLIVPSDCVKVGFREAGGWFSFFPVHYIKKGLFKSRKIDVGYPITSVSVQAHSLPKSGPADAYPPLPPDPLGHTGEVQTSFTTAPPGTKYDFTVKLFRLKGDVAAISPISTTPELYSVSVDGDPAFTTAGFTFPSLEDRILQAEIRLGLLEQQATLTIDNRDKAFNNQTGVFPITIDVGWYRKDNTTEPAPMEHRFTGFCTSITTTKRSNLSTATLECVGRKLQIDDALAVNLPIYDGYKHVDAVKNLLKRAGYGGTVLTAKGMVMPGVAVTQDFTLPLPLPGESPLYNFVIGTPIWNAVAEVAKVTGWWYFFDNNGNFYYCPPFKDSRKRVFKEVPSAVDTYDEVYALSELKDTADVRNAVLVIGMDTSTPIPSPIPALFKSNLTSTAEKGYIPWFRWYIIQDAKVNTKDVVGWLADKTYNNARRPRITASYRAFGQADIYPFDMIGLKLVNDTLGLPAADGDSTLFRVLTVNDSLDFAAGTYWTTFEVEYHDPNWSFGAWWDPLVNR